MRRTPLSHPSIITPLFNDKFFNGCWEVGEGKCGEYFPLGGKTRGEIRSLSVTQKIMKALQTSSQEGEIKAIYMREEVFEVFTRLKE